MSIIHHVKSEIEEQKITIDETITIQVMNSLDYFFAQFVVVLSHKAKKNEKLLKLQILPISVEDEELGIKNQDKTIANHAK